MKTIIVTLIFFSGLIFAQPINDSTQTLTKSQEREQIQNQKQEINSAQEQIGPKGNSGAEGKSNRKKKDVFIDKDGDGICDTRQSGMSFNKMRKRMGSGQKGPGKGQHGSGSGNGGQFGNAN
jgi:hypothetical protein